MIRDKRMQLTLCAADFHHARPYRSLRLSQKNIASPAGSILVGPPALLLSGLAYEFGVTKLRSDRPLERSDGTMLLWPCLEAGKWSRANVTSTNHSGSTADTKSSPVVHAGTNEDHI
jgi:hypothetical protein